MSLKASGFQGGRKQREEGRYILMDDETKVANANDKTKRNICLFLIFGMFLLFAFCFLLYYSISRATSYVPMVLSDDNHEVQYYIDIARNDGNRTVLEGWALIPGGDIVSNNTYILLRSDLNNEFIKLPTMMRFRPDVTGAFSNSDGEENFNYNNSGWYASLSNRKLNLPFEQYEIIILYRNNNAYVLVETGRYLEMR